MIACTDIAPDHRMLAALESQFGPAGWLSPQDRFALSALASAREEGTAEAWAVAADACEEAGRPEWRGVAVMLAPHLFREHAA